MDFRTPAFTRETTPVRFPSFRIESTVGSPTSESRPRKVPRSAALSALIALDELIGVRKTG